MGELWKSRNFHPSVKRICGVFGSAEPRSEFGKGLRRRSYSGTYQRRSCPRSPTPLLDITTTATVAARCTPERPGTVACAVDVARSQQGQRLKAECTYCRKVAYLPFKTVYLAAQHHNQTGADDVKRVSGARKTRRKPTDEAGRPPMELQVGARVRHAR
jgi:hypothetical protein